MNYFNIKRSIFIVPSNKCCEEYEKIDKFIEILNKSGIGKLIEQEQKKYKKTNAGNPEYNPFNLIATIIYCFSKFKGTVREIEDLCKFDLRVMYIMEQKSPNHAVIGKFINKYILPYQYEIFTSITKTIITELNINIDT